MTNEKEPISIQALISRFPTRAFLVLASVHFWAFYRSFVRHDEPQFGSPCVRIVLYAAEQQRFRIGLKPHLASCWPIIVLLFTVAAVELSYCAAHAMAYPNSPGGLPHHLYTDMSSMHISSPRAGHANASPYPQAPYITDSTGNPRMTLPPDLYNGVSSMHVSSPFQTHPSLPHVARSRLVDAPIDQKFVKPYYPSSHIDRHNPYNEYHSTSTPTTQHQDRKLTMKSPKVEDASRPSWRDIHQPASTVGNMPQGIATARGLDHVKTEDIEPDEMDWFDLNFPGSSRIGLQAVLDEMKARDDEQDKERAERGLGFDKELEERPNDPTLLKLREKRQASIRELLYFRRFNREAMVHEWLWRERTRAKKARHQGH
ncbi:hypothetical protein EVG20_g10266 [Dentipellis fragilis]|uniref:Uncharacterized protein n=1 Tax=Dentipellis fragilis TaxID=205917 RepID=A0A4Y9XSI3_9AGAM|nr:hypothetical protein EVG20_g10266 [Dentipellis fragilis]